MVLRDRSAGFITLDGDFAHRERQLIAAYEGVLADFDRGGSISPRR